MYNKIILVGNLTRDIEIRYTPSNLAIANTGLAVNRKFKSQTGEMKDEVLFVDLSFFGRTAEIANQYLKKGSKVLVEGKLKLDQWTDKTGAKRSKHSITVESMQMLDSKSESEALEHGEQTGYGDNGYGSQSQVPQEKKSEEAKEVKFESIDEMDEIPF